MKSKEEQINIREELELKLEEGQEHFHVLAVDDSVIERKMLEKLLTVSSYHVTCVESGDKALEYLGLVDHRPQIDDHDQQEFSQNEGQSGMRVNLIMTDYSMPGITGYDLLKRIKGSSWKDVPVIVMSSENVPSRIDMCLEEGAEDFLLKPVRLSDLKKLEPHVSKCTSTTTTTRSHCCGKMINSINISSSTSKDLLDGKKLQL